MLFSNKTVCKKSNLVLTWFEVRYQNIENCKALNTNMIGMFEAI